ncbi:MAG: DUF4258 domain-containing protein [Egibacteraceae bacterium]
MTHGFTRHARLKMRRLGLTVDDIDAVVRDRDVIERYTDRKGVLPYGKVRNTEVHVSIVDNPDPPVTLVTTIYEVDRDLFPDGRTRRRTP